jgi:hypothetical protein
MTPKMIERSAILFGLTLASTGCENVHAPAEVTCNKLRSLKVGMTPTDVDACTPGW